MFDIERFRNDLLCKDETLFYAQVFIREKMMEIEVDCPDERDIYAQKALNHYYNCILKRNIDCIFRCAESEIESIFLNCVNFTAFNIDPFSLVFTTEEAEKFRKRDKQIVEIWNRFADGTGQKESSSFVKWVNQDPKAPKDDKNTITTHIMLYYDWDLINSFHLSPQTTFKEISINNSYIRVDLFIWIPSQPNFKLIVECDGFKYHSDKTSFTADRVRDRILHSKGFQVLRFSGTEIFNNPLEKSLELYDYLIKAKEGIIS